MTEAQNVSTPSRRARLAGKRPLPDKRSVHDQGQGDVMPAQKRQAPLPGSVQEFDKRRAVFEAWLLERGSAIKQATNPYEVIRFMGADAECIVYRKASGMISHWANGAADAYRAFLDGAPWRASVRGKRDPKRTVPDGSGRALGSAEPAPFIGDHDPSSRTGIPPRRTPLVG